LENFLADTYILQTSFSWKKILLFLPSIYISITYTILPIFKILAA
jgi:hypothetical protein